MRNGYKLQYRFEPGKSFQKLMAEYKDGFDNLKLKLPSVVEVTVFPDAVTISSDVGFTTTYFAKGDRVVIDEPTTQYSHVLSLNVLVGGYRSGKAKPKAARHTATRVFDLGLRSVSAVRYHFISGENQYDVWATDRMPIPEKAAEFIACVLFGSHMGKVNLGLPLYVALRDPQDPDAVRMRWTAVGMKLVSAEERPDPKKVPEASSEIRVTRSIPRDVFRLGKSMRFSRTSRTMLPVPGKSAYGRRVFLSSPRALMDYGRRIGFTMEQEFWDQARGFANLVAGQYDGFDGDYDWGYLPEDEDYAGHPGALRVNLDLWSQLQPHLALETEELETQRDLIVVLFFLLGGTPVKQERRPGGLSPTEFAKYETMKDVLERSSREAGHAAWTIPSDADSSLADELTVLLPLITAGLSDSNFQANDDLDDIAKRFALIIMLGALQPATHGRVEFAATIFDETVIDYDDYFRGRLFVDAQVREILDQELIFQHMGLETVDAAWALWIADIGPILHLQVDSSTSLLESFTCEDDRFSATVKIPTAEIVLRFQSRLRDAIRVPLLIATSGAAALLEGTAEIQLDVTDIELSVSASLPAVTDDDGTGLGLTYTLEDLSFTIDEMTPITWNEVLKAAINSARQTVIDEAEDQVRDELGIGDAITLQDDEGNPKKLIPWPELLQVVDGPSIKLADDGTFFERTLWGASELPTAFPESGSSSVPHNEIPSLAYVFEHGFINAWVNNNMSIQPAQGNIQDVHGWADSVGVDLPHLEDPQAYMTGPSGEFWPPSGHFLPGPSSADELPDTPSCQNPPMVFPPSRYYQLIYTRYSPVVLPPPAGDSDIAGELLIRYDVALRLMERRQMLHVTVLDPSWGAVTTESSSDEPDIEHPDEEYHHPPDDDEDQFPGLDGNDGPAGGNTDPECEWMVLSTNRAISEMVSAQVTLRAQLLVGFTRANASFQKPLEAVLPSLGIAAVHDAAGRIKITSEVAELQTEEPFDGVDRDALSAHLVKTFEKDLQSWFAKAGFGTQPLTGVHYPSDSLGPFAEPLAEAFRNARLRQHGIPVPPGGSWNPETHQFRYISDGQGLLIWPITLDLDLSSLFI